MTRFYLSQLLGMALAALIAFFVVSGSLPNTSTATMTFLGCVLVGWIVGTIVGLVWEARGLDD